MRLKGLTVGRLLHNGGRMRQEHSFENVRHEPFVEFARPLFVVDQPEYHGCSSRSCQRFALRQSGLADAVQCREVLRVR